MPDRVSVEWLNFITLLNFEVNHLPRPGERRFDEDMAMLRQPPGTSVVLHG